MLEYYAALSHVVAKQYPAQTAVYCCLMKTTDGRPVRDAGGVAVARSHALRIAERLGYFPKETIDEGDYFFWRPDGDNIVLREPKAVYTDIAAELPNYYLAGCYEDQLVVVLDRRNGGVEQTVGTLTWSHFTGPDDLLFTIRRDGDSPVLFREHQIADIDAARGIPRITLCEPSSIIVAAGPVMTISTN
ncbi:MAG: hypothetical protein M9930_19005 [Anaerolineae bacterium]|nr:hypothetical protein [Anaerolineae bacterium]